MNIFATSFDHRASAQDLDDLRLCKMVTETAQMVATALRERFNVDTEYRSTHKNHPCNVWARQSAGNLKWLIRYGIELHGEFIHRRGKVHKAGLVLDRQMLAFNHLVDSCDNTDEPMTPFPNCARRLDLGLDFTHLPVHVAYRAYLNARWAIDKKRPKWTNTEMPYWADFEWKDLKNDA